MTTAYTLAMLGSDYDQGLVYYFKQAFEALGGRSSPRTSRRHRELCLLHQQRAGRERGRHRWPLSPTNYAQLIIEAASSQGFEGELLGSDTWDNNMVVESAKGKDVSVKITTFYQEGGNPNSTPASRNG